MKKDIRRNIWLFVILSPIIGLVFDDLIKNMPSLNTIFILSGIFVSFFLTILFMTNKRLELIDFYNIHDSTERGEHLRYVIFLKRMYYICLVSGILSFIPPALILISNVFENLIILYIIKYAIFCVYSFILLSTILLFKRIVEISKNDFKRIYSKISSVEWFFDDEDK